MILIDATLVHERPSGRSFLFGVFAWALSGLWACASLTPGRDVVARSRLGDVTGPQLMGLLERAARTHPDLARWRSEPALTRGFLEQWLAAQALADEARHLGLDRTESGREFVRTRRAEALVEVLETRLERELPPPSEPDVQAFLKENSALVKPGERLRLRHVFRRVAARGPSEQREHARAEMEALRQSVLAGADLGALARERSDSETAKFDGLIAPQARGQMPPSIESVVWALQPGELSQVVETPIGFHVFRLEERVPDPALSDTQQRDWARLRLTHQSRAAARLRERERLLSASGAVETLATVAGPRPSPDAVAFRLGEAVLHARDLVALRERLPFAERHTRTLVELGETEVIHRLLAWAAERDRLWMTPDAKAALADAELQALAELSSTRRLERWRDALPEQELRAFYDTAPQRFSQPALRLRVVVFRRQAGASPHATYERLESVARALRVGPRDLAATARELSEDESWIRDGDLGFVSPRDFALWAGPTAFDRVNRLSPGELAGPLLLESYREEQLGYEPAGHFLARLEERREAQAPSLEDARPAVARALAAERSGEAQQAIRQQMLRAIEARFYDHALARLAVPD